MAEGLCKETGQPLAGDFPLRFGRHFQHPTRRRRHVRDRGDETEII
jgi:hypothetical protein